MTLDITTDLSNGNIDIIGANNFFYMMWATDRWKLCDNSGNIISNQFCCVGGATIDQYNLIALDLYPETLQCYCRKSRFRIGPSIGNYQGVASMIRPTDNFSSFFPNIMANGLVYKIEISNVTTTSTASDYFIVSTIET